ncbi:MAG: hypothetical protein LH702_21525 [Phormidesmis sp. CAN_BIN44]|nr:hypothetical protein [Phormidesmis sp. CAN_BIN44]
MASRFLQLIETGARCELTVVQFLSQMLLMRIMSQICLISFTGCEARSYSPFTRR